MKSTVGELKKLLAGKPDDMPVHITSQGKLTKWEREDKEFSASLDIQSGNVATRARDNVKCLYLTANRDSLGA